MSPAVLQQQAQQGAQRSKEGYNIQRHVTGNDRTAVVACHTPKANAVTCAVLYRQATAGVAPQVTPCGRKRVYKCVRHCPPYSMYARTADPTWRCRASPQVPCENVPQAVAARVCANGRSPRHQSRQQRSSRRATYRTQINACFTSTRKGTPRIPSVVMSRQRAALNNRHAVRNGRWCAVYEPGRCFVLQVTQQEENFVVMSSEPTASPSAVICSIR